MSIAVSAVFYGRVVDQSAGERRPGTLTITGLAEGANEVLHGLLFIPTRLSYRPGAAGGWGETSAPDATKLYITVAAGGATAGKVDFVE